MEVSGPIGIYNRESRGCLLPFLADELRKVETILDVGCGKGFITLQLAKLFEKAKVIGVDISPYLSRVKDDLSKPSEEVVRRLTRNRYVPMKKEEIREANKRIELVRGDANSLPFRSETTDLTVAIAILSYVENPNGVIKELIRVTKPGGVIYVESKAIDTITNEIVYPLLRLYPSEAERGRIRYRKPISILREHGEDIGAQVAERAGNFLWEIDRSIAIYRRF